MVIKKVVVGPLEENSYIVGDEISKEAVVIDPGDEPDRILEIINDNGFNVRAVICTHGHFDHVGAVGDIKKATGASLLMHSDDTETYGMAKDQAALWGYNVDDLPEPDGFLKEGDEVKVGGLVFRVMHSPGHSQGGICLYGEGVVFSGDTMFQGSIGRTDFEGGDAGLIKKSIRQRLYKLDENALVITGHGPETTIGHEMRFNAFVRA